MPATSHRELIMPRFVILRHEVPPSHERGLHWDFMLECGGVLRTWSLAAEPAAFVPILAQPLADHRLAFLEYEGPLSGGRGMVSRWDSGEFDWLQNTVGVAVLLRGARIRGTATMECPLRPKQEGGNDPLESATAPNDQRWCFTFTPEVREAGRISSAVPKPSSVDCVVRPAT